MTGYRDAGGTSADETAHPRLIASVEECPVSQTDVGFTPTEPDSLPDPTWDRVTQASWESFPASDAPGWR
jgi:hypothetical protein